MQSVLTFIEELYRKDAEVPYYYDISCDNLEDVLYDILVSGSRKLYGNKEANELTTKEIENLREYMKSVGYNFKVKRKFINIFGKEKYELEFYGYIMESKCKEDKYVWEKKG